MSPTMVRFVAAAVFWLAVFYAAVNMATQFLLDAQIGTGIAAFAGLVWLVSLVREDLRWQRAALAPVVTEGELPCIGDDTFSTEPTGERRPHWDTDIMGAPE